MAIKGEDEYNHGMYTPDGRFLLFSSFMQSVKTVMSCPGSGLGLETLFGLTFSPAVGCSEKISFLSFS